MNRLLRFEPVRARSDPRDDCITHRRPDLNPIEMAFATLKAFLQTARPRTFDEVELVAIALHLFFTPQECLNVVQHCGYRVPTAP